MVEDAILSDVDILCPCALGSVITYNNVDKIKARIIVSGANNPLAQEKIDSILYRHKLMYIPDILANCGGVIDLDCEGENYSEPYVYKRLHFIYDKTLFFVKKSIKLNTSVLNIVNSYIENEVNSK